MTKLLLIIGFVFSFGAGVLLSPRLMQTTHAVPATQASHREGWLTSELNLTPLQQEQIKKIWSETAHRGSREQEDRRRQIRKDRDDAIAALIQPPNKEKFELVLKTYADQQSAMDREWRASFLRAEEKTKQILNQDQRKKYEEMLKNREAERAARERDQGRRVEDRATSRPGSDK
jgi:Spy/CpxP family protein refolding chaperone